MSQEGRLKHRRDEPREHDRKRQHRGELDAEGRNTLGDAAGHTRTLATLAQGRWDPVALNVRFIRATARSRAASGEHSACCVALHTYHDAGAMPRLPGLPSLGLSRTGSWTGTWHLSRGGPRRF